MKTELSLRATEILRPFIHSDEATSDEVEALKNYIHDLELQADEMKHLSTAMFIAAGYISGLLMWKSKHPQDVLDWLNSCASAVLKNETLPAPTRD